MFRDQIELNDLAKMDAEYRDLLARVLAIQADCEIGGPHLYVQNMLPAAPSRIDRLIVARTATEEIDHYRKMARVAGGMEVDVSYVLSWPNEKRYLEAFRGVINAWEDYAVFGFLIDRVGFYQLDEFTGCTYRPITRIFPEIIQEEMGRISFGTNTTAELAAKGDERKERVQKALDFWYIKALDMFGRADSKRVLRYIDWGLKRRTNLQAREEYIREVNPLIVKMGLEIPDPLKDRKYL